MKRIILTLLSSLLAVAAFAQKGSVTATIVDAETGETIPGAVLQVSPTKSPDTKSFFTSGYKGAVTISGLSYGEYSVEVSFLGYNNETRTFTVSSARQSLGEIALKAGVQIATVVK